MHSYLDPFGARRRIDSPRGGIDYFSLHHLENEGIGAVSRLPYSLRIILESLLRHCDDRLVRREDVVHLAQWNPDCTAVQEIPFLPARVLLQDFTGVPALVDLAAMRSALLRLGGDPAAIEPLIPAELVIDHSLQVDLYASPQAQQYNQALEFERNRERYEFLKWGQQAFKTFAVVPPGVGIVHQVNLEHLARGVFFVPTPDGLVAYPDTLVGTDSHTTMINGLGIVGWGVGGIEAEAVMLGQPLNLLPPPVIGFELVGELGAGATATDLTLTITEILRKKGVVGTIIEFTGSGLLTLSLPDRATLANMAPEYGATLGFFPMDAESLDYLRRTGREPELVDSIELYLKTQGLFYTPDAPTPVYSETLRLDLSMVEASLAGPRRPQDRVTPKELPLSFRQALQDQFKDKYNCMATGEKRSIPLHVNGETCELGDGSIVIAAITSCTNTSNPSVMLAAGLLAQKAVERGLRVPPTVKTSLAPGSRVVGEYYRQTGLISALETLGFHIVGYGCTTCIGNSGPLPESVAEAIKSNNLVVASVLSGNRNFEGRINPLTRANYLASPPLVVAYALAGTVDIDLTREPLGSDRQGRPVYLRDIWPSAQEIKALLPDAADPETYRRLYRDIDSASAEWNAIPTTGGAIYNWQPESTYIQEPPFFQELQPEPQKIEPIAHARVLALLGDSVTTDHIS
ncbi:aconitate hydratase AcnA, partial [candidate division KSB1 bacterium]|nr:aconitate hydratase AcnA [candidate division KSB1 bacterium]